MNTNFICPVSRPPGYITHPIPELKTDLVKRLRDDVVVRLPEEKPNADWLPTDYSIQLSMEVEKLALSNNFTPKLSDLCKGYITEIADPKHEWVSDFMLGKQWNPGHVVFLQAGCSLGKNTYVEELAAKKYHGRILILANRKANKGQILKRLGITDETLFPIAKVMSYQALELNGFAWSENLDMYDLIVVDESHYFLKDACFNARTNISLEKIMGTRHAVKIFMSATLSDLEMYLSEKLKNEYRTPIISSMVSSYIMQKNKQYIEYVDCIDMGELVSFVRSSDEGWLLFVDSIAKGEELKKLIGPDAVFISSETSNGVGTPAAAYRHLVQTESLYCRVIITTSLLDNGVNIKDRTLRNVYIDCNDRVEIIQMLGRKRCLDENDTFKLFLPYQTKKELWASFHQTQHEIDLWKDTKLNLEQENFPPVLYSLETEDATKCRDIIYLHEKDKKFYFNELGFYNLQIVRKELLALCQSEDPFLLKVAWLFEGITVPPIKSKSNDVIGRKIQRVMDCLHKHIGKEYPKKSEDFEEFQNVFTQAVWREFEIDKEENHRPNRILGPKKISEACRKNNIPLQLIKNRPRIDGIKVTTYKIIKKEY